MNFTKFFFSVLLLGFLASCSDPCDDVDCGVNGICDDGTCLCDDGYEGTACQDLIIAKYTGTWKSFNFACDGDSDEVTLVFEQGSSVTELRFYDLEEPTEFIPVNYDGDMLTVPSTVLDDVTVSGTGNLNTDQSMSWVFEVIEDGETYNCAGTFLKQ